MFINAFQLENRKKPPINVYVVRFIKIIQDYGDIKKLVIILINQRKQIK